MGSQRAGIHIAIDRGGTFCDIIARAAGHADLTFKLLSVDPQNYPDAPTEAIRRVLEAFEGRSIPVGELLDGSGITSCRIGTTIATNALLEHKGENFAFATTKGFRDVCVIGDQTRPDLFALNVKKANALHQTVIEIDERVTIEDYDLNPFPASKSDEFEDPALLRTASGEVMRILKHVDVPEVRKQLKELRQQGYRSLAICLVHSYLFPDHERIVASLALEEGFQYVTTSVDTSPVVKHLRRSVSTCSEAYLYPVVQDYVQNFQSRFRVLPQRVEFMCSDGGLRQAHEHRGNQALLSGPAGGVVAIAQTCYDDADGAPLIGFDMGGTSTDVCRFDGRYDHLMESTIAGRTIVTPMLNISTVAAGGGSILSARNSLFNVGPESAGAEPGPACYRKGGPLTVTDANAFLGRLVISSFPAIFGENANEPLDLDVVKTKFTDLTASINAQSRGRLSPEEVALGFLKVANTTMSRPIRNITEARGFAPEKHNLVSFGGAGGQHACAIADDLGIRRVLIHKYSSMLSAYGIMQAKLQYEAIQPMVGSFGMDRMPDINTRLDGLKAQVTEKLVSQGADPSLIDFEESLVMYYRGTDTSISVSKPTDGDYGAAFRAIHLREFAFVLEREIVIDSFRVRGVGSTETSAPKRSFQVDLNDARRSNVLAKSEVEQKVFIDGVWTNVPIYRIISTVTGTAIQGPALLIDDTQTIFVEPSFQAYFLPEHVVLEKREGTSLRETLSITTIDPIHLSVFAHRFMAIAEQMGSTLQRTSISTSIRERLDFSCAIFSADGKLVANAPHIPIHLGSMQFAIRYQHDLWRDRLKPGDVLLTNHPECGGTHLPDLTVVTPVFVEDEIAFYVASRGHHTDIGGKGITSMMPDSKELWEEGLNVRSMKIVSEGSFLEQDVRQAFELAGNYPGCSPTRRLQDNISDLKAQISSNQRGITLLGKVCDEFGLAVVQNYMGAIQTNAEFAVRDFLRKLGKDHPGPLTTTDHFDDGTPIQVCITVDKEAGSAVYDFRGTGPQLWGNYNCPISITHSAVIYTIRCLISAEIPLNEGCLVPIKIVLPKGSVLRPDPSVAICGSTLASQRVVDTILRAFGRVAASQGCANSFGWGMGGKDSATGKVEPGFNYGESIGGGTGAGPGWNGEHVTQCHSTNTRITDAEIIEKRTPVIVKRFEINRGSGGKGQYNGGDGCIREIEARVPLKFSILSDRRVFNPYGLEGGQPGSVGKNYVFRWNKEGSSLVRMNVGGKAALSLKPGEIMQINTPGGGGWGVSRAEKSGK